MFFCTSHSYLSLLWAYLCWQYLCQHTGVHGAYCFSVVGCGWVGIIAHIINVGVSTLSHAAHYGFVKRVAQHQTVLQYMLTQRGFNMIYLAPAYGRAYTTRDAMIKDWIEGKDFKILSGPWPGSYTSMRDSKLLRAEYGQIVLTCPRGGIEVRLGQ